MSLWDETRSLVGEGEPEVALNGGHPGHQRHPIEYGAGFEIAEAIDALIGTKRAHSGCGRIGMRNICAALYPTSSRKALAVCDNSGCRAPQLPPACAMRRAFCSRPPLLALAHRPAHSAGTIG